MSQIPPPPRRFSVSLTALRGLVFASAFTVFGFTTSGQTFTESATTGPKKASATGYSQSLSLGPALIDGLNVPVTLEFRAPGEPESSKSRELSPVKGKDGVYRSQYVYSVNSVAKTNRTFQLHFPIADTDENGVLDFLQAELVGDIVGSGVDLNETSSRDESLGITFKRKAGSKGGTFSVTSSEVAPGKSFNGSFETAGFKGNFMYQPEKSPGARFNNGDYSLEINLQIPGGEGDSRLTGTGGYTVLNDDCLVLEAMEVKSIQGTKSIQMKIDRTTMVRRGRQYFADLIINFASSEVALGQYRLWRIVVVDLNDSDNDGIPDLTDVGIPQNAAAPWIQYGNNQFQVLGPIGMVVSLESNNQINGRWFSEGHLAVGETFNVKDSVYGSSSRESYYRLVPSTSVALSDFVWVPSGVFEMGSRQDDGEAFIDEQDHKVTITRGFWMCKHEVTQSEFESVMGFNPAYNKLGGAAVDQVSWNQAVEYCVKLTRGERLAGRLGLNEAYRLPTESEWEYAARAGSAKPRYDSLDTIAWWRGNSQGHYFAVPVMGKSPNAFGLYDMIGNVMEWCDSWYGEYPQIPLYDQNAPSDAIDPVGPLSGTYKVWRGGSLYSEADACRAAYRNWSSPSAIYKGLGFRVVRSVNVPGGLNSPKVKSFMPLRNGMSYKWLGPKGIYSAICKKVGEGFGLTQSEENEQDVTLFLKYSLDESTLLWDGDQSIELDSPVPLLTNKLLEFGGTVTGEAVAKYGDLNFKIQSTVKVSNHGPMDIVLNNGIKRYQSTVEVEWFVIADLPISGPSIYQRVVMILAPEDGVVVASDYDVVDGRIQFNGYMTRVE